ncbi:hypothetical protein [Helicobacter himalayensis]|nr:hypothetical protein [Helicobacter himalayensis]
MQWLNNIKLDNARDGYIYGAEVVCANKKILEQKNAQVTKRPKIYFALA